MFTFVPDKVILPSMALDIDRWPVVIASANRAQEAEDD